MANFYKSLWKPSLSIFVYSIFSSLDYSRFPILYIDITLQTVNSHWKIALGPCKWLYLKELIPQSGEVWVAQVWTNFSQIASRRGLVVYIDFMLALLESTWSVFAESRHSCITSRNINEKIITRVAIIDLFINKCLSLRSIVPEKDSNNSELSLQNSRNLQP